MSKSLKILLQAAIFGVFAMGLATLSVWPAYEYRSADVAIIKLSLSHATNRTKPCVILTAQELAKLAPNMRKLERCERERVPLTVELDIDGQTLIRVQAPPTGLWSDGASAVYETLEVSPGTHTVTVRLRDSARTDGWDFSDTTVAVFEAQHYFTVTFAAEDGGFTFR